MVKYGSDCIAGVVAELDNYDHAPGGSDQERRIRGAQGGVLCDIQGSPAPYERDEPGRIHVARVAHGTEVVMDNLNCTLFPGHSRGAQLALLVRAFQRLRARNGQST